jgi:hypothetical protein
MSLRMIAIIAVCALAAACSSGTRIASLAIPTNEHACVSYGFVPGTAPYTVCVQREAVARTRGQMGPDYDQVLIAREIQEDCQSYGVPPDTVAFERCVQRETSYRRPN